MDDLGRDRRRVVDETDGMVQVERLVGAHDLAAERAAALSSKTATGYPFVGPSEAIWSRIRCAHGKQPFRSQ
jgi:hypothetical protein